MAETQNDVERILVVTAHPDDLDFGAAGTIASWTNEGIEVSYCICTNGDAGGFDPSVPRSEIPNIRQNEQREAARHLGVSDIHFLGYSDGRLSPTIELRRDISRVIRKVRPQRVLSQSPEINYERIYASHPDHRAAGEAALCAVYPDARNPFAHPELALEGFEAWTVDELWIMAGKENNRAVDVTDFFDKKVAALRSHVSQTEHLDTLEDQLREWGTHNAEQFGLPAGRLAEAFRVVDTK